MAHVMKAIQAYSPRVTIPRMVKINEIVDYIADRTGLSSMPRTDSPATSGIKI